MSPLLRNLAITAGLALIAWLGYVIFLKQDETLVTEDRAASEAVRDGQEFLMRIRQLDQVQFNGSILIDQRFTSLMNFGVELEAEDVGRDNPFASIPGLE